MSGGVSTRAETNPTHSLDDLVGAGEDCGRDRQSERLSGLEIDYQLESGGLLDWQNPSSATTGQSTFHYGYQRYLVRGR
jgi:hypothetical protein